MTSTGSSSSSSSSSGSIASSSTSRDRDSGQLLSHHLIASQYYNLVMPPEGQDNRDDLINSFSDRVWGSDNSTMLHIAACTGKLDLVNKIVQAKPELLFKADSNGDLPIHVAARIGHKDVVEMFIGREQPAWMLELKNKDGSTPLHIALENKQENIAQLLHQKLPKSFYSLNEEGVSPLYLAVKAEFWQLAKKMLEEGGQHSEEAQEILSKPYAKSVIHAAIMAKNKEDIIKMIGTDYAYLIDSSPEEHGMTPFSYAAHIGFLEAVKYLSVKVGAEAFQPNSNGSFPIHKACSGGDTKVIEYLLEKFPDTKWLLNKEGQSILHIAARYGNVKAVKSILKNEKVEGLINMKDKSGNTCLHLAALEKQAIVVYTLTRDPRVHLMARNRQGQTAYELAELYVGVPPLEQRLTSMALIFANAKPSHKIMNDHDHQLHPNNESESQSDQRDDTDNHDYEPTKYFKDRFGTLLTVSTLVATVTFAAGFTVPGGYRSDSNDHQLGLAILARKHGFQVFVLSNLTAFFSSIFAAVTLIWGQLEDFKLSSKSLQYALPSLALALAMMSVAYMAGLFVVLVGLCTWLAVVVLALGGTFSLVVLCFFVPLFFPTTTAYKRINKLLSYVFCVSLAFISFFYGLN